MLPFDLYKAHTLEIAACTHDMESAPEGNLCKSSSIA